MPHQEAFVLVNALQKS